MQKSLNKIEEKEFYIQIKAIYSNYKLCFNFFHYEYYTKSKALNKLQEERQKQESKAKQRDVVAYDFIVVLRLLVVVFVVFLTLLGKLILYILAQQEGCLFML